MTLVGNFLDFGIEECPFGGFDYKLEWFPIFKSSWFSVFAKDQLQSSFHHFLGCLVMLTFLVLENQACSSLDASELMICSSDSRFVNDEVSRDLNMEMTSLTNFSPSSLFLGIVSLEDWTNSSAMGMVIVRGAWSDISHQLGWIMWPLSSLDLLRRNIRSMTELDSPVVSEYLSVDCSLRYINLSYENHVVKFGNHKFRKND